MKRISILILLFLVQTTVIAQSKKVLFETNYGSFKVVLYDFTPHHQQLFLDAIKDDVYKDAFFNRIIEGFVVQGGMHDDEIAQREVGLPENEKKRLPAEFDSRAIHKIGVLGAGRDVNEQKASFLNQIYFVVGKKVTQEDLDAVQTKKGITYTAEQQDQYLNNGGLPRLDGDYTVFGEVYEGYDVLEQISKVRTNVKDAPLQAVSFSVSEINE